MEPSLISHDSREIPTCKCGTKILFQGEFISDVQMHICETNLNNNSFMLILICFLIQNDPKKNVLLILCLMFIYYKS